MDSERGGTHTIDAGTVMIFRDMWLDEAQRHLRSASQQHHPEDRQYFLVEAAARGTLVQFFGRLRKTETGLVQFPQHVDLQAVRRAADGAIRAIGQESSVTLDIDQIGSRADEILFEMAHAEKGGESSETEA